MSSARMTSSPKTSRRKLDTRFDIIKWSFYPFANSTILRFRKTASKEREKFDEVNLIRAAQKPHVQYENSFNRTWLPTLVTGPNGFGFKFECFELIGRTQPPRPVGTRLETRNF